MDVRMETIGHWLPEFHEQFRVVVEGLTTEQLPFAPAPDTNPIAVLVRHAVLTEHGMLGGLAGQPIHRDLPGEFVVRRRRLAAWPATAEELLALLDEADRRIQEMLPLITTDALGALYQRPHDQVLTGGEWAVHTYGHAKEHLAHAELTRQLFQAER